MRAANMLELVADVRVPVWMVFLHRVHVSERQLTRLAVSAHPRKAIVRLLDLLLGRIGLNFEKLVKPMRIIGPGHHSDARAEPKCSGVGLLE